MLIKNKWLSFNILWTCKYWKFDTNTVIFFTSKIYLPLCHSERLLRKKDTTCLISNAPFSSLLLQVITCLTSNLLLMIGPCFSWVVFLRYPQLLLRLTNRQSLSILLRLLTEWKFPFSVESCVEMCCPVSLWLYSSMTLQQFPFFQETVFSSSFLSGEIRVLGTHSQACPV